MIYRDTFSTGMKSYLEKYLMPFNSITTAVTSIEMVSLKFCILKMTQQVIYTKQGS